jgi:phosphoglycolate phosphatase-like HAD superfamily hydrolase
MEFLSHKKEVNTMKKLTVFLLALAMITTLFAVSAFAEESGSVLLEWNPEAPALKALIEYVEDVTNEASPNYIPDADRIATFDMDGTLCAELYPTYLEYWLLERRIFCDPSYTPDEEMLEFGCMLRDHALDKSFPDGMDVMHGEHAARAYAGMTLTEFQDFVTNQLVRKTDGFEGMTVGNSFYLPMIEVVEYLQENGFKVYVCSGSDRFLCRTFIEGVLDIPYEQIIGMDVDIEATNEEGEDGLNYVYTSEDNIVRTDRLLIKNLKMNKVKAIVKEIGRQPVLSFGNSSGDVSMHNYTICNNRYRSMAFMLIADDEERDYGNAEKVQPLKEKWEQSGYQVISMRDDFRTIYGDDVKKTGVFHWLEEFAEPVNVPEKAEAEQGAGEKTDVQYVLYLGTNDKDTNKPVFTQEEALEKAKDILIRCFGGYTIQEAHGGWVDGDTHYQEYTLVIFLSDTTPEQVHAAADEMIETFRQSSVLIQENPTRTEFYFGK